MVSSIIKFAFSELKDSPNEYLWRRLEALVECMVSENQGIPIRKVKNFMSVIPSVFSGNLRFEKAFLFSAYVIFCEIFLFIIT